MSPLVIPSAGCRRRLRMALDWARQNRFASARVVAGDATKMTHAYAANLAHRLPLLYSVVLFNVVVMSVSFWTLAPLTLTLAAPAVLMAVIGARAVYWLPRNVSLRTHAHLQGDLARLGTIGPAAAFACTVWALALYPFGDPARQNLVHYMTAVTCFAGILGLGQAPGAASRMAIVTMLPATLSILYHQPPNWLAIGAVQIVVTGLLLLVTYGYHADFVALEMSRQALGEQEKKAARLADDMQRQATRDALTGVASRGAILARLEAILAAPSEQRPWLALLDLDGFKNINDTFGHAAGDLVLKKICARIERSQEVIACGRLGGDEFALLLDGKRAPHEARAILEKLALHIAEPIKHDAYALSVTASVGLCRTERTSVSDCLERADEALYNAKRLTRGAGGEFGSGDEQAMRERAAVTRLFSSADLHSRIDVVFQPIVDFDLSRPYSFEALARWSSDNGEILAPDTFIPLAESTGRISELTEIVLSRALHACPAWQHGARLSVNLSACDILREGAADWLGGIVSAAGAPPGAIGFEITETALVADLRRAAANLEALRALGFEIALDDFGTGQSSLSHVHRLPLDHIKLDRTFASGLESSRSGRAVATTVLALTRQLDLSCSIEGIETAAQAAAARSLGFRLMQGYYFGMPLPAPLALAALSRAA